MDKTEQWLDDFVDWLCGKRDKFPENPFPLPHIPDVLGQAPQERPLNWDAIDNETKQAEEEESEDKKDEQLVQEDRFYRFIEG